MPNTILRQLASWKSLRLFLQLVIAKSEDLTQLFL
jgi:hypothetical protein